MPNLPMPESNAALYVMGALNSFEKREFEALLAQSDELRAEVHELEEGLLALALTSPRKQPPAQVWKSIEKSVAEVRKSGRALPLPLANWWRSGWAAAAACLLGWILFAFWNPQPEPEVSALPPDFVAIAPSMTEAQTNNAAIDRKSGLEQEMAAETTARDQMLRSRTEEVAALRQQIAGLENQVIYLSQSVTQKQAQLGEPSRIKFFQLAPFSIANNGGTNAPLSPALQRAVFLAMAGELGWLPPDGERLNPGGTNEMKVDFVDLRPGRTDVVDEPYSQPKAQSGMELAAVPTEVVPAPAPETPTTPPAEASSAIPAFLAGDDLVVAIDATVASSGSQLTFWDETGTHALGSASVGENPLVIRFNATSFRGFGGPAGPSLIIMAEEPSGLSEMIQLAPREIATP